MPVTVAFANQKGGVGKTTCAGNFAGIAAMKGIRTLFIDHDPQCNATVTLLGEEAKLYKDRETLAGIYAQEQQPLSRISFGTRIENLSVIPGSLDLAGNVVEISTRFNAGQILSGYLSANAKDYDLIVIDCPPDIGIFTLSSFVASDWIVIPMQTERYAFSGFDTLNDKIRMVQNYGANVQVMGIVATMYDGRMNSQKGWLQEVKDISKDQFLGTIHRSSLIAEASDADRLLVEMNTRDRPYREFLSMAKEIYSRAGLRTK